VFSIIIFLMSVVVHEVSHGFMAKWQGDPTAELAGRLTMNPIKHIDPVGSIFLPLLLIVTNSSFVIGWAKPVPFNPYNLRNKKWGEMFVAIAGPLSNVFIAVFFGLLIRFSVEFGIPLSESFFHITGMIVIINLILAIFNLVPIPPLDGSKILFTLLPSSFSSLRDSLERYGFIFVLIFVIYFWQYLTGISL
jgi:Zn-dependent protease